MFISNSETGQDQAASDAVEAIDPVPSSPAAADQNPDSNPSSSPSALSTIPLEASPAASSSFLSSAVALNGSEHVCKDEDEGEYSDPEFDLLCSQIPESILRGEETWKGKAKEE